MATKTRTTTTAAGARAPRQLRLDSDSSATRYEPFFSTPNPGLADFVRARSQPYRPAHDGYAVVPFDRDPLADRAAKPKAVFDMHSYWSKKHWTAVREYVDHYLPAAEFPPNTGIVLDPFGGSGMTGVASMLSGHPVVLVDVSPAAAFLEYLYTHPIAPDEFDAALEAVVDAAAERIDATYATTCDGCKGTGELEYAVWAERFQCPSCAGVFPITSLVENALPDGEGKALFCPDCLKAAAGRASKRFAISTRSKRFGAVPVRVCYRCNNGCRPARRYREALAESPAERKAFQRFDAMAALRPDDKSIVSARLKRRMLDSSSERWGVKWRPNVAELRRPIDLFTARNAAAVDALLSAIDAQGMDAQFLYGPLNAGLFFVSRMCRAAATNYTMGVYSFPPFSKEINARKTFLSKCRVFREAMSWLHANYKTRAACVSNQSATDLDAIPDASIDYVFTDPPYINKEVQYGEMNFPWDSVLGATDSFLRKEIALNEIRGIDWDACVDRLRIAFTHCYRVLKPGRYASVCYHDASEDNWKALQDVLLDAGFEIVSVNAIVSKQKAEKQVIGEKVVKSDLVVNCRKPRPGERASSGDTEAEMVSQRVRQILVETLSQKGGQPRDLLWDVVLKRLLSRGQMAEHRFEDLLSEVAFRSESGRWFLKEEYESLSKNDVKNEESAGDALARFARLRMSGVPATFAAELALSSQSVSDALSSEKDIVRYIRANLIKDKKLAEKFDLGGRLKGVEFYDCLFFYLTRWLKGRSGGMTPRRNLAGFLDEYLVRFKEGDKWRYRAPDDAEAESLKAARQTGLGRRIRQFVSFLNGEGDFPKERLPDAKTLVAWLKHCAAFGLAEEGAILWEKGGIIGQLGQLSEDERYDAEDYYRQCKRRAGRTATEDEVVEDEESETEEGSDE